MNWTRFFKKSQMGNLRLFWATFLPHGWGTNASQKHQRNSSLKPPFFSLSLEGPFLVAGSRTQEFFCSVDLTIRQVTKKKRQSRFFPGGKEREGGRRPKSLSNDELSFLCWDCIKNLLCCFSTSPLLSCTLSSISSNPLAASTTVE